jgi:hypothetical protein
MLVNMPKVTDLKGDYGNQAMGTVGTRTTMRGILTFCGISWSCCYHKRCIISA